MAGRLVFEVILMDKGFIFFVLATVTCCSFAQVNQGGGAYECTQVIVEDTQGAELTKEEEIAALEGALHDSIDRFESCVGDVDLSGSGQGAGSGSGSGSGAGSGDGTGSGSGLASSTTVSENQSSSSESATPVVEQQTQPDVKPSVTPDSNGNGSRQEDIPPADNDTVLQRQIRKAAEAETDPQRKKELWELYKKYKG